ncbi:hypothetical protein [Serratia phage X20]|uniref:DUF7355 domain-containing protein n=1 Tax=Serratia phage X20 TaxID=2006942 RepID=A0A1Z1LZF2_9CAUD|nr:hypothetical protein KNT72_gp190 [Serratia phage X20]ARW58198.1 hypothetical protein [Serratia phage X20]
MNEFSFPTFKEVAGVLVRQVVSNYMYQPADVVCISRIHADLMMALKAMYKFDVTLDIKPDSFGMVFDFNFIPERDMSGVPVRVDFSWG